MSAVAVLAASALAGCATGPASDTQSGPIPATSRQPPGAQVAPSPGRHAATVRVGGLPPLRVEVADGPAERSEGLSGRRSLPAGTGMLFRFQGEVTASFWMYDVQFPLSLAWVRDRHVIGTVEMTPCTAADPDECRSYAPPGPYDTAIEAPAGTFARVEPGARVTVRTGPASS